MKMTELFIERAKKVVLVAVCIITFFVNNTVVAPDIMEARNMVTAREMVYDSNWLIPTMNGALRLEKPPLPTWFAAIAEILSPDSLALQRGMAGLAALLLVFYFYRFAKYILCIEAVETTLFFCTCYSVVLMGRTATWDIYCHAFMMAAIYYLVVGLDQYIMKWRYYLLAGVFTGLSFMSKGPVSLYALLLPFLISYFVVYKIHLRKQEWKGIAVSALIAVAIGSWWYIYVHYAQADHLSDVIQKESGSWLNHNVRPWYYYWSFFLETGIWAVMLITVLADLLIFKWNSWRQDYRFVALWMLLSVLLLSFLPEKKNRYLFPVIIPACYAMYYLYLGWAWRFKYGGATKSDKWSFRINSTLITVVVAILPAFAYKFVYVPGYISLGVFITYSVVFLALAFMLLRATYKLKPKHMLAAVTILFVFAEMAVLPNLKKVINNPEMRSVSEMKMYRKVGYDHYHNADEPMRIEVVYASGGKVLPLDLSDPDAVMSRTPCILLTHKRVGEELPKSVFENIDTTYIGRFDDNRWAKSSRRYNEDFIYHATKLKEKVKPRYDRGIYWDLPR